MKRYLSLILIVILFPALTYAGNKDRVGQAGGSELLINPWARSSGMAGANTASVRGLEAMHLNVAGLAFVQKTELMFARTNWLQGSDIGINTFGFGQKIGESGVLGIGIMSMDFGEIDITTVNQPEGGLGTFSPQYLNIGISYAKTFSNSIYGGATVRAIQESISNASAQGVALDAGIKYVTGKQDNLQFGIALRNVGPKMKFSGDGFSTKIITTSTEEELTVEQRREAFELPSLLNIGVSYDFYLGVAADTTNAEALPDHRITAAGNFTSNSFGKDQVRVGVEYGFKTYAMVRAGFVYEEGILETATRTTSYTGPTAGFTIQVPLGKNNTVFGLDYSYRASNPFAGTHSFGARITI